MGTYATATLFYGYILTDVDTETEDLPFDPFDWPAGYLEKTTGKEPTYNECLDLEGEFSPVTVGSHGYRDDQYYYLAVFEYRESGYDAKEVPSIAIDPSWNLALDKWFEVTGWPKPEGGPKWYLVADYS